MRGDHMISKKKHTRVIPKDIPIYWVNIVESSTDDATLL
jgi:hypothetical protein